MLVRSLGVVVLACAMVCSGCSAFDGSSTEHIDGLRSDPDHRGLLATYLGGACDGPAKLAVEERPDRIDVSIVVGPDPQERDACIAVGIPRTVSARLSQPIGNRTVWSEQVQQVPFDGARLLVPLTSVTPTDFGGSTRYADAVHVSDTWTLSYNDPGAAIVGASCSPAVGSVDIELRPRLLDDFTKEWTRTGAAKVGDVTATLYHDGNASRPPTDFAYVWPTAQGVAIVTADVRCGHYRQITAEELLRFARSLSPA